MWRIINKAAAVLACLYILGLPFQHGEPKDVFDLVMIGWWFALIAATLFGYLDVQPIGPWRVVSVTSESHRVEYGGRFVTRRGAQRFIDGLEQTHPTLFCDMGLTVVKVKT